ncbi:MAG: AMP-binding protein [Chloroflexi bacterium]|nr:AMP-binding protein [Chloroflexota bacterium]
MTFSRSTPHATPGTLPSTLARHAQTIPDQPFTRILKKGVVEKQRTFAEAWTWSAQWAALFAERGLKHGEAVIIALPNCDAFVGAYFGALMAGVVPAPVAPARRLAADDPYLATLADRIRFVNAKALVVPSDQAKLAQLPQFSHIAVLAEGQAEAMTPNYDSHSTADDLGLVQFTSGTSGDPKAVLLTQRALLAQTALLQTSLALYDRFKDWAVSWLPLFHDMGLIGFLLTPAYTGGLVNLIPAEEFVLRPASWLRALSETKATITGGPPSAYALCAKRLKDATGYDLSAVRVALVGAETVTRDSLATFGEKFAAAGFRSASFTPTYGLAEAALAVTMPALDRDPKFDEVDFAKLADGEARPAHSGDTRLLASVGPPLPGVEVAIVADDGSTLPERRTGEIIVRSPSLMSGYHANAESTEYALRNTWLWTGDLGYLADGELYLTGRKKEVIIVGGRNYYPDDVEQIASAVPGVRAERVVAIGVEDAGTASERLVVLAEFDPDEDQDALRLRLRQTLVAAGYPAGDVILLKPKSIQSTLTGKLKRLDCKARYLAGEFGSTD